MLRWKQNSKQTADVSQTATQWPSKPAQARNDATGQGHSSEKRNLLTKLEEKDCDLSIKMTTMIFNKDPLVVVKNMDSYFKQIPPDCSLFCEDGSELPIHKELLYQTRFMRRMLKSANMDNNKIEIMCPFVAKRELEIIVKFLYTGQVYCGEQAFASQVFNNLTQLFGFPSRNFEFDGIILKAEREEPNELEDFSTQPVSNFIIYLLTLLNLFILYLF